MCNDNSGLNWAMNTTACHVPWPGIGGADATPKFPWIQVPFQQGFNGSFQPTYVMATAAPQEPVKRKPRSRRTPKGGRS